MISPILYSQRISTFSRQCHVFIENFPEKNPGFTHGFFLVAMGTCRNHLFFPVDIPPKKTSMNIIFSHWIPRLKCLWNPLKSHEIIMLLQLLHEKILLNGDSHPLAVASSSNQFKSVPLQDVPLFSQFHGDFFPGSTYHSCLVGG